MKCYSKVLGGRNYSLFETVHSGLRSPAIMQHFRNVRSISISDWSIVKRGDALRHTQRHERPTFLNKRGLSDARAALDRPSSVKICDLEHLSKYVFWRLFDVNGLKLVRKQLEQFVELPGTGWASHAKMADTLRHPEYAKRTSLAYMPCPGLQGASYIADAAREHFSADWTAALFNFVTDPQDRWYPTWIVRNYEVHSDIAHGPPHLSLPPVPGRCDAAANDSEAGSACSPQAGRFKTTYKFERSGEPPQDPADENAEPDPYLNAGDRWTQQNRPAWQQHGALGPNANPEGKLVRFSLLEALVNTPDYNYAVNEYCFSEGAARAAWDMLAETSLFTQTCFSDAGASATTSSSYALISSSGTSEICFVPLTACQSAPCACSCSAPPARETPPRCKRRCEKSAAS